MQILLTPSTHPRRLAPAMERAATPHSVHSLGALGKNLYHACACRLFTLLLMQTYAGVCSTWIPAKQLASSIGARSAQGAVVPSWAMVPPERESLCGLRAMRPRRSASAAQ